MKVSKEEFKKLVDKWMEYHEIRRFCRKICKGSCCSLCKLDKCTQPLTCALYLCPELIYILKMAGVDYSPVMSYVAEYDNNVYWNEPEDYFLDPPESVIAIFMSTNDNLRNLIYDIYSLVKKTVTYRMGYKMYEKMAHIQDIDLNKVREAMSTLYEFIERADRTYREFKQVHAHESRVKN